MSFIDILLTLFIGPLKLVFEIIFDFAHRVTGHPGLAIIVLSLIMNVLVLPLYKRADAMQEEARDIDEKLHEGVAHIKKTFSGDERMMILQTFYRQNNYKPSQTLNGSVSLLLEIPFFMAAYQFLSNLKILDGVAFGPITNMGAPDGLLVIGALSINVLPILMTVINVVSSAIYLKGFPLKTKVQLYAMAAFFLVFLYKSPACLVFYWTLNNVFSLVKNIFYKIKNPKKVLNILLSVLGVALIVFALFIYSKESLIRNYFIVAVGCIMQLPLIYSKLKKHIVCQPKEYIPDKKVFFTGAIFTAVLTGLLIPSTYVAASPMEYVEFTYFYNPNWYIVNTMCMAVGTFVIWMGVFYWISNKKGKVIFEKLIWILSGVMFINYMFFGTNFGNISINLKYDRDMVLSKYEVLINMAAIFVVALVMYIAVSKWKKKAVMVLLTAIIAVSGMSAVNVYTTNNYVEASAEFYKIGSEVPTFELSKKGKNVVVIMLDRAINEYVPVAFNEKPELKEQYSGFTYYNNVISFGAHTNLGVPALLGGYEYTPIEMNRRDTESLIQKHNEALKVVPAVFYQNGYDVTVCDPPYAGYTWIPDLSIYDEFPGIKAYTSKGKFTDNTNKENVINSRKRNFFCFSIMKTMPLMIQPFIYDGGMYNSADDTDSTLYTTQKVDSMHTAVGISNSFIDQHNVLENLINITEITEDDADKYLFFANDSTHEATLLQTPDYVPSMYVNNIEYDEKHAGRFTVNGETFEMKNPHQMVHYHVNMASYLRLGEWFEYLKENDVYDNTRIIIASDHAYNLEHFDGLNLNEENLEFYYPLLMVKDFNSTGFNVSDEFMTNADVPNIAVSGIIDNPTNPFTGELISDKEKYAHEQFISASHNYDVMQNNGNTYTPSKWLSVEKDMRDIENWKMYNEEIVLQEYKIP